MEAAEKIYQNYEYLAAQYANKVFEFGQLGYEYQDVLQEFKIKIFTSIRAYLNKIAEYNAGKVEKKPVPIKYYLQSACSNKLCDLIKFISRENHKVSLDEISYDFGMMQDTIVEPEANRFVLNGVDLLEGLKGKQRAVFSLYLRGYNKNILNKVYCSTADEKRLKKELIEVGENPVEAMDVVRIQCEYLVANYGNDLLQVQRVYSNYQIDEE